MHKSARSKIMGSGSNTALRYANKSFSNFFRQCFLYLCSPHSLVLNKIFVSSISTPPYLTFTLTSPLTSKNSYFTPLHPLSYLWDRSFDNLQEVSRLTHMIINPFLFIQLQLENFQSLRPVTRLRKESPRLQKNFPSQVSSPLFYWSCRDGTQTCRMQQYNPYSILA